MQNSQWINSIQVVFIDCVVSEIQMGNNLYLAIIIFMTSDLWSGQHSIALTEQLDGWVYCSQALLIY